MTELYQMIIEFIKNHIIGFWTGLTVFVIGIISVTIILIIGKRKKKRKEEKKIKSLEAKKLKAEIAAKVLKEENILNDKKKIEIKLLKEDVKSTQKAERKTSEHKTSKTENVGTKEPEIKIKTEPKQVQNTYEKVPAKPIEKSIETLPEAKEEEDKNEVAENLFVNYQLDILENIDSYAVIRIPKSGCIVRSHRFGNTKRRGYKEESFQKSIQKYFGSHFIVSGEVRLNTGKETRPFEPDIAIIDENKDKNIRIDIEIDEPYAGITRQPTHCKGEDLMRDTYFVDRGWLVIRFSEYQVHTQEIECLKYIADIINAIDSNYIVPNELFTSKNFKREKLWDIVQAQKWEKAKFREEYLNHTFGEIPEETETIERDFNEQEINEEKFVTPSLIGIAEKSENIGYNQTNVHPRDKRIVFYPEPHIYTIDGVPVPSASTIISKFFPEFDSYGKASNLSSSNPLYGLPVEDIVQIWNNRGKEAANQGTYLHEQIEKYYLNQPFKETEEFHLFKQFVAEHKAIKPYRSEWRIFDDKFNVAGTIDLISANGNGYDIYDWKRSKKVVDTYSGDPIKIDTWGNHGVGNLSDISDTSYNRYCLQQSLYRYILENNYGLKISKMYLIVLYPEYDRYYKVETPYLKDRIEYILKTL